MPTFKLLILLLPGEIAALLINLPPAARLLPAVVILAGFLFLGGRGYDRTARIALLLIPSLFSIVRAGAPEGVRPLGNSPPIHLTGTVQSPAKGGRFEIRAGGSRWGGTLLTVRAPFGAEFPQVGEKVSVQGTWSDYPWPRNPGEPDWYGKERRRGGAGLIRAESVVVTPDRAGVSGFRRRIHERTKQLGEQEGALLRALLLGDRSDVAWETTRAFRDTGLSHLLALSGLHLGILYIVISAPMSFLGVPVRLVPVVSVLLLWGYGAVVSMPASLFRALVMASVLAWGRFREWPVNPWNALGAAAVLALAADPAALIDVGFQLSFAATGGILAIRPLLSRLSRNVFGQWILSPLVVSLGAQLATLPLVLFHFGRVAPLSALATLAATPFTILSVVSGAAWLLLGPVHCEINRLLGAAAWASFRLLETVVIGLADRGTSPWMAGASFGGVIASVGGGALLILRARQTKHARHFGLALAVLFVPMGVSREELTITVLDIGQGSAAVLDLPGGERILIDAGLRSPYRDMGARVIAPFLSKTGSTRLDMAFISHPDADHLGGVVSLMESGSVKRLIDPGLPHESGLYESYEDTAIKRNCQWSAARSGVTFAFRGGVFLDVLFAPEGRVDPAHPNDASLVLLLRYGEFRMLFPGDAPPSMERHLTNYRKADRLTLLVASHHGAGTGCLPRFLERARPQATVISCGAENRYGHPHPAALRRLDRVGTIILRTDEDGAVTIRTDGRSARVEIMNPTRESFLIPIAG